MPPTGFHLVFVVVLIIFCIDFARGWYRFHRQKQNFYNYFCYQKFKVTRDTYDTCDTLEWIIVVVDRHYVVTGETSGALFVLSNSRLHCCAK